MIPYSEELNNRVNHQRLNNTQNYYGLEYRKAMSSFGLSVQLRLELK